MSHETNVNISNILRRLRLYRWKPATQEEEEHGIVNPREVSIMATSVEDARAILHNEHNSILNRMNTIREDNLPPLEEWEQDVPHEERVRRHVENEFDENLEANHLRICFPFSSIKLNEQVLDFILNNEPFEIRAVPRILLSSGLDG